MVSDQLKDQVSNLEKSLANILRELVTQHDQITEVQAEAKHAQSAAQASTTVAAQAKAGLQSLEAEDLRRCQHLQHEIDGIRREVERDRVTPQGSPRTIASRTLTSHEVTAAQTKMEVEMLQQMKSLRAEQREDLAVLHTEQRKHAEDSAQFRRELWSLRESMPSGRAVQSLNERCAELDRALMSQREEQQQLTTGVRTMQEVLARWQPRWPDMASAEEFQKFREEHKVTLDRMQVLELNMETFAATAARLSEAAADAAKPWEAVDVTALGQMHEQVSTDLAALRKEHEQLQKTMVIVQKEHHEQLQKTMVIVQQEHEKLHKTLEAKHHEAVNSTSSVSADLMAQRLEHQTHLREVMDHIQAVEAKQPEAMRTLSTLSEDVMSHHLENQNKFKSALHRIQAVEGKNAEAMKSLSALSEDLMSHRLENQNKFKSALDRMQNAEGKIAEAVNSSAFIATDLMTQQLEHRTNAKELADRVVALETNLQEVPTVAQHNKHGVKEVTDRVATLEAHLREVPRATPHQQQREKEMTDRVAILEANLQEVTASLSAVAADLVSHRDEQRSSHLEHQTNLSGVMSHMRGVETNVKEAVAPLSSALANRQEQQVHHRETTQRIQGLEAKHEEAAKALLVLSEELAAQGIRQQNNLSDVLSRVHGVEEKHAEQPSSISDVLSRLRTVEERHASHLGDVEEKHAEQQSNISDVLSRLHSVEARHESHLSDVLKHQSNMSDVLSRLHIVEERHESHLRDVLSRVQSDEEKHAENQSNISEVLSQLQSVEERHQSHLSDILRRFHSEEDKLLEQERSLSDVLNRLHSVEESRAETSAVLATLNVDVRAHRLEQIDHKHELDETRGSIKSVEAKLHEAALSLLEAKHTEHHLEGTDAHTSPRTIASRKYADRMPPPIRDRALETHEKQVHKGALPEQFAEETIEIIVEVERKLLSRIEAVEAETSKVNTSLTTGSISSRLEALEADMASGQIPSMIAALEKQARELISALSMGQITARLEALESAAMTGKDTQHPKSAPAGQIDPDHISALAVRIAQLETESGQVGSVLAENCQALQLTTRQIAEQRVHLEEATSRHWEAHHQRISDVEAQMKCFAEEKNDAEVAATRELEAALQAEEASPQLTLPQLAEEMENVKLEARRDLEDLMTHLKVLREAIQVAANRRDELHEDINSLRAEVTVIKEDKIEELRTELNLTAECWKETRSDLEEMQQGIGKLESRCDFALKGMQPAADQMSMEASPLRQWCEDSFAVLAERLILTQGEVKEHVDKGASMVEDARSEMDEAMSQVVLSIREGLHSVREGTRNDLESMHKKSEQMHEDLKNHLHQKGEEIHSRVHADIHQKGEEIQRSMHTNVEKRYEDIQSAMHSSIQNKCTEMHDTMHTSLHSNLHSKCGDMQKAMIAEMQKAMHSSVHEKYDDMQRSIFQKHEEMQRSISQKHEELQASMHQTQEGLQRLTPREIMLIPAREPKDESQVPPVPFTRHSSNASSLAASSQFGASSSPDKDHWSDAQSQAGDQAEDDHAAPEVAREEQKMQEAPEAQHAVLQSEVRTGNAPRDRELYDIKHERTETKKREAAEAAKAASSAEEERKHAEAVELAELAKYKELQRKEREAAEAAQAAHRMVLEEEAKVKEAEEVAEIARLAEHERKKREAEAAVEAERLAHEEQKERIAKEAAEAAAVAEDNAEMARLSEETAKEELKAHKLAEAAARLKEDELRARHAVEAAMESRQLLETTRGTHLGSAPVREAPHKAAVESSLPEATHETEDPAVAASGPRDSSSFMAARELKLVTTALEKHEQEEGSGFKTPAGGDLEDAATMMSVATQEEEFCDDDTLLISQISNRSLFSRLDLNNDGVIDREEMKLALATGVIQEAAQEAASSTAVTSTIHTVETKMSSSVVEQPYPAHSGSSDSLGSGSGSPTGGGGNDSTTRAQGAGGSAHEGAAEVAAIGATDAFTAGVQDVLGHNPTRLPSLEPIKEHTEIEEDAHMEQLQKLIEQAALKGWDGTGDHRHHQMVRAAQQHLKKLQKKKALRQAKS